MMNPMNNWSVSRFSIATNSRVWALVLASFVWCGVFSPKRADAVEAGMQNVYEKVRFRLFRNGHFLSEIIAEKANASQLDKQDPRVDMEGVVIEIYDSAPVAGSEDKPPLKARITSDKGTYMRALDPESRQMQEIAILRGHVVVCRYLRTANPGEKPELESTVLCDEAKWNNSTGVLNGTGNVTMFREDGTLRLTGVGMIYEIDKGQKEKVDLDQKADDLGGILEIQRSVRMEIQQRKLDGKPDKNSLTVVTSQGPGRYDLDQREMFFTKEVAVQRNNMQILCDKLKVLLAEKDAASQKFREMFAESAPTGMVDIRGRGNPNDPNANNIGEWRAKARYARYQEEAGELLLTDDRPDFLPLAQLENHLIRNTTILFFIREERLFATGVNGETILNSEEATVKDRPKDDKIVIRYKDKLIFDQKKSVAQFTGDVRLTSSGLQMDSEKLVVDFIPSEKTGTSDTPSMNAGRVSKVTASDNVRLLYQQRRARCAVLEIDPNLDRAASPDSQGYLLVDQFRMTGTPLPEIELPGGGYFQSRHIVTTRFRKLTSDKKIVRINATGPGSGLFGGSTDTNHNPTIPNSDATTIRYSDRMLYDEVTDTVDFTGDVTATKGDQVLRSDRLMLWLASVGGSQEKKEIKQLRAIGNASMHWGLHHCEADIVDRRISLNGNKENDYVILTGKADHTAKIWEENGASFQGNNIRAASDGSWVRSQGGGELSMLDRDTNERAMVLYSGEAYYAVQPNSDSYAIFTKNVIMKRGDMTVTGDRMRADMVLVKNQSVGEAPDLAALSTAGASTATLPRRLKRVIVDGNVVIKQGKRTAYGSRGQVDVNDDGDVMLLEGDTKRKAEVTDNSGFKLFAPRIMVKEVAGIITAAGPGEVRITGTSSAQDANVDAAGLGGVSGRDSYTITYKGKLLYNMLLRKIRFEDDVRMMQDTLYGTCKTLTVYLNKSAETGGEEAPMQVETAEAAGDVRFTRLPEPPNGRDPYSLPGNTVLTRSEEVLYKADEGLILLTSSNPQQDPAILMQENMGGQRSRRIVSDTRIWVFTRTGDFKTSAVRFKTESLPTNGPMRFPDER